IDARLTGDVAANFHDGHMKLALHGLKELQHAVRACRRNVVRKRLAAVGAAQRLQGGLNEIVIRALEDRRRAARAYRTRGKSRIELARCAQQDGMRHHHMFPAPGV
ncbi:MAG: hypothetical protein ACXWUB_12750, partial [Burkholderiales bacterium]